MMSTRFVLTLIVAAVAGCATTEAPDPLERLNRKVFAFNDGVDATILKPLATTYLKVTPEPVRAGVGNFFSNAQDIGSAANLVLQGRPVEGGREAGRFATNSVLGILGFVDVATPLGLERHRTSFGSTLTQWGVEPGAYIVWPLLGPSCARDAVGIPIDWLTNPLSWLSIVPMRNGLTATELVAARAAALPITNMIDDVALDRYLFVRDAYLQRHRRTVEE